QSPSAPSRFFHAPDHGPAKRATSSGTSAARGTRRASAGSGTSRAQSFAIAGATASVTPSVPARPSHAKRALMAHHSHLTVMGRQAQCSRLRSPNLARAWRTSDMKAAIFHGPHKPLTIENVDIDKPIGREVLVKVVASGVCHSDLHFVDGYYPFPTPAILGHEAAGIVEEVGLQVGEFKPGDHVIACLSV